MNDRPIVSIPASLTVGLILVGTVTWGLIFMCIFGGGW